jgi:hypothetical protein
MLNPPGTSTWGPTNNTLRKFRHTKADFPAKSLIQNFVKFFLTILVEK